MTRLAPHVGQRGLAIIVTVWLVAVSAGLMWMVSIAGIPGPRPASMLHWPEESVIAPPSGQPLLVCMLHPACPCSLATVNALAEVIGHGNKAVRVIAVLARSDEIPGSQTSRVARAVRALPITVIDDRHGEEAQRFSALTSGDCTLFSGDGRVLFRGGLTDARGHGGHSRGIDAVLAHLSGKADETELPVFGCAINDKEVSP